MSYEWEREEHRDALRHMESTPCYRHDYRRAVGGGGVCIDCGDSIREDEL
ncbi:hypothetical protein [Mycobacterium sp. 1245499.0]|nr:hypothetical protein [Mycobacterium sp. 1245499.0]